MRVNKDFSCFLLLSVYNICKYLRRDHSLFLSQRAQFQMCECFFFLLHIFLHLSIDIGIIRLVFLRLNLSHGKTTLFIITMQNVDYTHIKGKGNKKSHDCGFGDIDFSH